jgi:acyl-CoA thioesterase
MKAKAAQQTVSPKPTQPTSAPTPHQLSQSSTPPIPEPSLPVSNVSSMREDIQKEPANRTVMQPSEMPTQQGHKSAHQPFWMRKSASVTIGSLIVAAIAITYFANSRQRKGAAKGQGWWEFIAAKIMATARMGMNYQTL